MTLSKAVAIRIETLLCERKLSQYRLSKLSKVPRQTINAIVKVQHKKVALNTVYKITVALGMSPTEFFDAPIFKEVTDST